MLFVICIKTNFKISWGWHQYLMLMVNIQNLWGRKLYTWRCVEFMALSWVTSDHVYYGKMSPEQRQLLLKTIIRFTVHYHVWHEVSDKTSFLILHVYELWSHEPYGYLAVESRRSVKITDISFVLRNLFIDFIAIIALYRNAKFSSFGLCNPGIGLHDNDCECFTSLQSFHT